MIPFIKKKLNKMGCVAAVYVLLNELECFDWLPGGLNHSCPSCGICFSSVSTLSAHITYYCSKSPKSRTENPPVSETYNGRVLTPEIPLDVGSDDPVSLNKCSS